MIYILIGFLAFLLYVIYDINSVTLKNNILNHFFFLGSSLLILATIGMIIKAISTIEWNLFRIIIGGIFTFVFLFLLIYTLFFALPFEKTYVTKNVSPKVYTNGVYALCRHPGVLWFIGFYFFLWVTFNTPLLLIATIFFSICNLLYVVFQDLWTFPQIFEDYQNYQEFTPFIVPNFKSIKRCLQTLQ